VLARIFVIAGVVHGVPAYVWGQKMEPVLSGLILFPSVNKSFFDVRYLPLLQRLLNRLFPGLKTWLN